VRFSAVERKECALAVPKETAPQERVRDAGCKDALEQLGNYADALDRAPAFGVRWVRTCGI
jgi:hypothetical protein